MTDPKNYYKILGLIPGSSMEDVKKAYRNLAVKYHPDKVQDLILKEKTKEKFIKIGEAYQILSDENKKQNYDKYGNNSYYSRNLNLFSNSHDEIFNHFENMFRQHMRHFGFDSHLNLDLNFDKISKTNDSYFKSSKKTINTEYINGKKYTIIKETINENDIITETITTINDKGEKKVNVKNINNQNELIKDKKRPNF
jgi:DnaJ-class molecular chaperone